MDCDKENVTMKTTLLIMAAGLGSRYGGDKQIDRIGPAGDPLMKYSIYDALAAGFEKKRSSAIDVLIRNISSGRNRHRVFLYHH